MLALFALSLFTFEPPWAFAQEIEIFEEESEETPAEEPAEAEEEEEEEVSEVAVPETPLSQLEARVQSLESTVMDLLNPPVKIAGGTYRLELISNDAVWYNDKPWYSIDEDHTLYLNLRIAPSPRIYGNVELAFWADKPAVTALNPRPYWVLTNPCQIYIINTQTGEYKPYSGGSVGEGQVIGIPREVLTDYDTDTVGVFIKKSDLWLKTGLFHFHIFKNVGHPGWADLFNLYWDSWEVPRYEEAGQFIPQGVEILGQGVLSPISLVVGEQPLFGEDPLIIGRISKRLSIFNISLIHRQILTSFEPKTEWWYIIPNIPYEDINERVFIAVPAPASKLYPIFDARTQATALMIGASFLKRMVSLELEAAKFKFWEDSFAFGGRLKFNLFDIGNLTAKYVYRQIYAGNKQQVNVNLDLLPIDILHFFAGFMWREPLSGAPEFVFPPLILDEETRSWFPTGRWLDNRKAIGFDVSVILDLTPRTWFREWNANDIEDAPFAIDIGYSWTKYPTWTDYQEHYDAPYHTWWVEQQYDPYKNLYTYGKYPYTKDHIYVKFISNLSPDMKLIGTFDTGVKEAWVGSRYALTPFTVNYTGSLEWRYKKWRLYALYANNDWGPYYGQDEWGIVYDHRVLFKATYFLTKATSIALQFHGAFDKNHKMLQYSEEEMFHYGDISFKDIRLILNVGF